MYVKYLAACIIFTFANTASAQSIFDSTKQPSSAANRLAEAVKNTTKEQKSDGSQAKPATPVSSAASSSSSVASTPAPTPAPAPTVAPPVSISEQSALQARKLAEDALEKISVKSTTAQPVKQVPELKPDSAIQVVLNKDVKKSTPPVPTVQKPYLAMIMGIAGSEIAEFQLGGGRRKTVRVGETVQQWRVAKIQDGAMYLMDVTPPKPVKASKAKAAQVPPVPASKVLHIGDFL